MKVTKEKHVGKGAFESKVSENSDQLILQGKKKFDSAIKKAG